MKVLLDENITQKSIKILEKYGHNVIHVLDRLEPGKSDNDVFALALLEKRALITLNGKHFIVFIPPQTDLVLHYGLVWLRGFQVTNKSYPMCRKTPCFSYGDIRHFHRIYVSN